MFVLIFVPNKNEMKLIFDITFRDSLQNKTKEQLEALLNELHGKEGRTAEVMRKQTNQEINKRIYKL